MTAKLQIGQISRQHKISKNIQSLLYIEQALKKENSNKQKKNSELTTYKEQAPKNEKLPL